MSINFSPEERQVLVALSVPIDHPYRNTFKDEFFNDKKRISICTWRHKIYVITEAVSTFSFGVGAVGMLAGGIVGAVAAPVGGIGAGALAGAIKGGQIASVAGLGAGCLEARKVLIQKEDNEYNYWLVTHKLILVLDKYAKILSGKILSSTSRSSDGTPFRHPVRSLKPEGKAGSKLLEGEDLTPEELKSTVFDYLYFQYLIDKTSDIFNKAILKPGSKQDRDNIDMLRFAIIGYNNSGGAKQILEEKIKMQENKTYRTNNVMSLMKDKEWEENVKIHNKLKKQNAGQVSYIKNS